MPDDHIEKMWYGFRTTTIPANAPQEQLDDMRRAFFCGASALFTLIARLGPDDEETAMRQMSSIQREVDKFGAELDKEILGKKS